MIISNKFAAAQDDRNQVIIMAGRSISMIDMRDLDRFAHDGSVFSY